MDWLIHVVTTIVVGAIIGWLAGIIMKSNGSLLQNIVCGILGGAVGGVIGGFLPFDGGFILNTIFAIVGACLIIAAVRAIRSGK
jgi:uncharacterized membrane protein YeaQ/YmgE (transglycosylase-associated protein family)